MSRSLCLPLLVLCYLTHLTQVHGQDDGVKEVDHRRKDGKTLVNRFTLASECWQRASGFKGFKNTVTTHGGCTAHRQLSQYIVGGSVAANPDPSFILSHANLETNYAWESSATQLPVQMYGGGGCTNDPDGTMYVTAASARSRQLETRLFVWPVDKYWTALSSPSITCRYRGAVVSTRSGVFLFGGVCDVAANSGSTTTTDRTVPKFVPEVEWYDRNTSSWSPVPYATMSNVSDAERGLCDCVGFDFRLKGIYLACTTCNNSAPTYHSVNTHIIKFDPETRALTSVGSVSVESSQFLSMEATQIAQFVVLTISDQSVGPKWGPKMFFYDVVLQQMAPYASGNMQFNRYSGSTFVMTTFLNYNGGIKYNKETTWPNVSSEVDTIRVYPDIKVTPNRQNQSYELNGPVGIVLELDFCTTAVRIRMATNLDCKDPVPGLEDQECLDYKAYMNPTKAFDVGYVCASYGTCAYDSSEEGKMRQQCPGYNISWRFTECLLAQCCFEPAKIPGQPDKCWQFNETEKGRSNANDTFFYAAIGDPFSVHAPKSVTKPQVPFMKTEAGIAVITGGVVFVLVVLAAVAIYVRRTRPDAEEHPLEANSKYKLLKKLGQGGFGTVFLVEKKVRNVNDQEQYAMKYIACQSEEDRGYAMKEIELVRSAQGHTGMIRLVDMFMSWGSDTANGKSESGLHSNNSVDASSPMAREKETLLSMAPRYVCIVMEYFPEGDLSDYILDYHRKGASEEFVLHTLGKQVASCLHHIHACTPPIVHRDLKPENLLLADGGRRLVLTDFGLAQQQEKSYMTTRAGSLHYVAPECWKRHYTCAVDMWALGCIMYACATGRVGSDTARVMFSDAKSKKFEQDIRYDLRKFTKKLQDVVIGLLQVDPNKRLKSGRLLEMLGESVENPDSDCYCN